MKIEALLESNNVKKAGIIPFIMTERGLEMLFMVSSNAAYGGPDPMISKGHVDEGESPDQAALREGNEELGLKTSNCVGAPFLVKDDTIQGLDDTYVMRILAVEVKNKTDFDKPHYETAHTVWMTLEEYQQKGRRSQLGFVQLLAQKLQNHG